MPLKILSHFIFIFIFFLQSIYFLSFSEAKAAEDPVHWSALKTKCDRKKNFCELNGEAALHQKGESLYADHIELNLVTRLVKAKGHVIFLGDTAMINASEMDYHLDEHTGTIIHGLVSNDSFSLSGEKITKLGIGHYKTTQGEYTTCRDCPKSWSITADTVDLEVDGYAFMHGVVAKVNDASAFWLPYLIIPIKTKRQSGFLFPKLTFVPTQGFTTIQPYFWATSRSVDMTFGVGQVADRGIRFEWETRAKLSKGEFQSNYFYMRDKTFRKVIDESGWDSNRRYSKDRWSLFIRQKQSLPFGIEEKFNFTDVSDSFYPSIMRNDFALGDPNGVLSYAAFLPSTLSFSKSTSDFSSSIEFKRYRNLLTLSNSSSPVEDARLFDPNTVQVLPEIAVHSYPKSFFEDAFDFSVGATLSKFTRSGSFYDKNVFELNESTDSGFIPGKDPIRKATRINIEPTLSRSFRLFDKIEGTATTTFKQYFYHFDQPEIPGLTRNYLQFELDLFSQLEKVYTLENEINPKVKHLVRPTLKYSFIPYSHEPLHPFTNQIKYANNNNFTGYQFDNNDIVPLDSNFTNANYFAPEGNAITYGFNTALIRKIYPSQIMAHEDQNPNYVRALDWSVGQTFNFRELRADSDKQPLSRVFSNLNAQFDRFGGYVDYYYVPYLPVNSARWSRHIISTSLRYALERDNDFLGKSIEKNQKLFPVERSIEVNYTHNRSTQASQADQIGGGLAFSINDYFTPKSVASYSLITKRWLSVDSSLTFRSPSQCWMVAVNHHLQPYCPEKTNCSVFGVQWGINIDGGGYGGVH